MTVYVAVVDEKERRNGNDPEKELVDSGFHDYRRPLVALVTLLPGPVLDSLVCHLLSVVQLQSYPI